MIDLLKTLGLALVAGACLAVVVPFIVWIAAHVFSFLFSDDESGGEK